MNAPIRYAKVGDFHLAYQVAGGGPIDIVFVPEFWHSIDAQWDEPSFARFLTRLSSFSRLICYDKRGTGRSDPLPISDQTMMEQWIEDILGVCDAVGSERTAILTSGAGAMVGILFAAKYPQRVSSLLYNGFARFIKGDDYPWGYQIDDPTLKDMDARWGEGTLLDKIARAR